ncbi:hypothetical protein C8R47DRAFT_140747 [Mycena vitilis]|nr:hypothetical protein C8R47DRAFT_140747 [Mycena vitilis]
MAALSSLAASASPWLAGLSPVLPRTTLGFASTPDVPSDFRMIPLGDIDLLREIHVKKSQVIKPPRERGCVRRVYSAKVDGRKSGTTVALYQGDGAEEEWRHDTARYMSVRHPNIIQLWGAATSGKIHVTLFHDELVPFGHFMDRYRHSPILTVYIYACCSSQFRDVDNYMQTTIRHAVGVLVDVLEVDLMVPVPALQ